MHHTHVFMIIVWQSSPIWKISEASCRQTALCIRRMQMQTRTRTWTLCIRWTLQTCDDWYTNGHFCCLTVFDDWYTVGTVLVNLWRLVHQWSFLLFWLYFDCFLTIGTLLVHGWYSLGKLLNMWRLVHQWSFLLFWLSFDCFLTIGTLLVQY